MVKVRLVAMGNIVDELNSFQITHWKSRLFSIEKEIKRGILPQKADAIPWAYSDGILEKSFSKINHPSNVDITFYILDAPIENNYLSRVLSQNRIVLTFYQAKQILEKENIPLENYVMSHIYAYVLLYLAKANKKLEPTDEIYISHDYKEGCLFDMCGVKSDVIYKCVQPIICEQCKAYLISHGVLRDDIKIAEKEQKKLKRTLYNSFVMKLKSYPVLAFVLSLFFAFLMSILANYATGNCEVIHKITWCAWFLIIFVSFIGSVISKKYFNI